MSLTINSRLCIAPIGRPPVIRVGQYDSNFEIEFEMYTIEPITWDLEEGTTAMIRGTKTDKRGYSADCDIDISNKKVTVYGDVQMTAAAGPCVYEIVLKKNDKEISSINFTLQVERAALDADTIPSESKIKEIQDLGQKADEIIEAYENLQFDSTPTAGSTKAVTSGGIKTYVDEATETIGEDVQELTGDVGDLEGEITDLKSTINGLTFSVDSNGVLKIDIDESITPTPDPTPDPDPVVSILDLNRTESSDAAQYYSENVYINPSAYDAVTVSGDSCTVANKTTNSITVTSNAGGKGCAYPISLSSLYGETLILSWTATGSADTRFRLLAYGNSNWKNAMIDNSGTKNTSTISISNDGSTITVDGTSVTGTNGGFTYMAIFFGAATGKTVSYTNVSLSVVGS